jgi:hypothetical protein
MGFQSVAFWMMIQNGPRDIVERVRFVRPDGTLGGDTGDRPYENPPFRMGLGWYEIPLDLDVAGTWHVVWDFDDQTLLRAPFEVVASAEEIVNRPPAPIEAYLDPPEYTPDDVVFCRVSTDPVFDDPDYDIVRYEYEWLVDGEVLRVVEHAGQADALARHTAEAGDRLECRVTPSDGLLRGDTVTTVCNDLDPTCIRADLDVKPGSDVNPITSRAGASSRWRS